MFMENIIIAVLDKYKEHYLGGKDKAQKTRDILRNTQLHLSKYKKNWRFTIHNFKPTAQLLLKS